MNCGQQIVPSPPDYSNKTPVGFTGSSNSVQTVEIPKKNGKGLLWILVGVFALIFVVIGGIGVLGFIVYRYSGQSDVTRNYNTYNSSNTSRNNTSSSNSTTTTSTAMTEKDKYRLFYAASKVGDQTLTTKVSKKIGIIDESGLPTGYYKDFVTGMFKWASDDTDFVQQMDNKQKALDYVNARL